MIVWGCLSESNLSLTPTSYQVCLIWALTPTKKELWWVGSWETLDMCKKRSRAPHKNSFVRFFSPNDRWRMCVVACQSLPFAWCGSPNETTFCLLPTLSWLQLSTSSAWHFDLMWVSWGAALWCAKRPNWSWEPQIRSLSRGQRDPSWMLASWKTADPFWIIPLEVDALD